MDDAPAASLVSDAVADLARFYRDPGAEWAPAYLGNLLNWGYWADIDTTTRPGPEDRVRASADLYRLLLRTLGVRAGQRLIEVGCGLGGGIAVALTEFRPAELHGIDAVAGQARRAEQHTAPLRAESSTRLLLTVGSAEAIPCGSGRFHHLYSIEAAQHFTDVHAFAGEAYRVLRAGGRLGVATFFPSTRAAAAELRGMLPTFRDGVDTGTPLSEFTGALADAGFTEIDATSIGDHVWQPFDEWIASHGLAEHPARRFLPASRRGLLDYYVVTADKPG